MADSYIQLPTDGAGKKVDADSLTVGPNTVLRERDRIAGAAASEIADVRDDQPGLGDFGLVVRPIDSVNPVRTAVSTAALAAGDSANLDGSTVPNGITGRLQGVVVSGTLPAKWVVKARSGLTELTVAVLCTSPWQLNAAYAPPSKYYDTVAGNGADTNFRVTVLNLDNHRAADFYASFYHDETA